MLLPRVIGRFRLRFTTTSYHLRFASTKTHVFKLADIGEGITECEVVKWEVGPGPVTQFQPLLHVQSDKATVELTSPFDGTLSKLLVEEGQVVKVGAGLCEIQVDVTDAAEDAAADVPEPGPAKEEQIVEESKTSRAPIGKKHPLDPSYVPSLQPSDVLATPATRHFARSNGVDLENVRGTGKSGRVERTDVEAYMAGTSEVLPAAAGSGAPSLVIEDRILPFSLPRLGMFKSMTASLAIPHFGYSTKFDITQLHHSMPRLNSSIPPQYLSDKQSKHAHYDLQYGVLPVSERPMSAQIPQGGHYSKMTYLPFLLNALGKAMMDWPLFRCSLTTTSPTDKPTLTLRSSADVLVALSTPTGLYTPLLPSLSTPTTSLDAYAIQSHLTALSARARTVPSQLTPKDMPGSRGGTLTVSNVGAVGLGTGGLPRLGFGGGLGVIVLGRAEWTWSPVFEPGSNVPVKGEGEWKLMLPISIGADHRFVEGAEVAGFMECWRRHIGF